MAILLCITDRNIDPLREKINSLSGGQSDVWIYPEVADPDKVEMAVLWKHPKGLLTQFPNLKLVSSLGAGVEHILEDPTLPEEVQICRIVDDALTISMRNYITMAVLNIHRRLSFFQDNQQNQHWDKPAQTELPLRIGLLGLGVLGGAIATFLCDMGFEVFGYSRKSKQLNGVTCFSAETETIDRFAQRVNMLICLLPRTLSTEGILNYTLFRQMSRPAFLINVARGAHLVEADLVRAMQEGIISEAYLDVFREEPLAPDHPFWTQSGLVITPHIASLTDQDNAAQVILDNYRRLQEGRSINYLVNRKHGY